MIHRIIDDKVISLYIRFTKPSRPKFFENYIKAYILIVILLQSETQKR